MDLKTAIAFLTTRVNAPNKDDRKKLMICINYLSNTVDSVLTLKSNESGVIKWWVDAEFSIHHNMQSHTNGCMSRGKRTIYSMPTKQRKLLSHAYVKLGNRVQYTAKQLGNGIATVQANNL